MAVRVCPACGVANPPTSRFCHTCGTAMPAPEQVPGLGRYSALRFQVDPSDPPPVRDARWVVLVLSLGGVVVGIFLLVLAAVIGWALTASGDCRQMGACPEGLSLAFLVPGAALLAVGTIAALRTFHRV